LWVVVVIGLTAVGLISMTTIPAWPVVGVAVATAAILLNTVTRSLSTTTCLGCGGSLQGLPDGTHGRICPGCGAVNERLVGDFPAGDSDRA